MRNESKNLNEKRFSFLAHLQKEIRYANTQLAHCLLPDTPANASQNPKSHVFLTNYF